MRRKTAARVANFEAAVLSSAGTECESLELQSQVLELQSQVVVQYNTPPPCHRSAIQEDRNFKTRDSGSCRVQACGIGVPSNYE